MLRPPNEGGLGCGAGFPPPEPEPPQESTDIASRREKVKLFIYGKKKLNT
tara:strand:- start:684 stop:833 length:150 start_codon:yes stop_codon:yes gene_type:complete